MMQQFDIDNVVPVNTMKFIIRFNQAQIVVPVNDVRYNDASYTVNTVHICIYDESRFIEPMQCELIQ